MHRAPATFPTKDSATAWLEQEKHFIELDRLTPGTWRSPAARAAQQVVARLTLRDYAATWLTSKTTIARRTRDTYRWHLDALILPTLGDLPVTDVTPALVRLWFAELGTATPTRNARAYGTLKALLNTAVADDLIDRNPCRIRAAAQVRDAARSVVLVDPGQLAALAEAMPTAQYRLAVLLAGWCGLRRGELMALRRCDLADDGATVRVERAVTYRERRFEVGVPKTKESRRTVAVPPHLRPVVVEHLARHVGRDAESLVFTEPATGSFAGEGRFRTDWAAARTTVGLPGLHFHDLRHAAGVLAALSGATTRELMDRLGHTTSAMSMRYQHTAAGRDAALADRLSALAKLPDKDG